MDAPIHLGAWEKALLFEHWRDCAYCSGWIVELDQSLDPELVIAALTETRRAFPLYFARVQVSDDGVGVAAAPEPARPVGEFLRYLPFFAGGASAYARLQANARLDPFADGLFRCHLVDAPTPFLGFQSSHIAGDGYSNTRLRIAFADAVAALAEGGRSPLDPPACGHDLGIDEITEALPMDPRALEDIARRNGRLRAVRMTMRAQGQDESYELRLFQAAVTVDRYATVVARARGLGVTPLALLGAAFALAVRDAADPWEERLGDFLGISVPHDLRGVLGRIGQIGNLALPQGIPIFADDPRECGDLARVFLDRLRRGQTNRLMYRHFITGLREAEKAEAPRGTPSPPRLRVIDGRLVLDPFPAFGVTEVPHRGEVKALGPARVVKTYFQTPLLTRRFAEGMAHLSCAVRWHPAFDARLRAMFAQTMSYLFDGKPVEWVLL